MEPFQFKNQDNPSLRHRVTAAIRDAIIQGHLRPGDKLRELELSAQMGVSRGPIREALRDLAALGLIVSSPYRETTVADVGRAEVTDLLIPIRLRLELYALRQDSTRRNAALLRTLEELVGEMSAAAAANDLFALTEADIRFHENIVAADDSAYTQHIWSSIVNRLRIHFIKNTKHFEDLARVPQEHAELLEALKEGEAANIEEVWTRHILHDDSLLCFRDEQG